MLESKLKSEIIEFLELQDYNKLYEEVKESCYPLIVDILSSVLILLELLEDTESLDYMVIASVLNNLLEFKEDSNLPAVRLKHCLAICEKIKSKLHKPTNFHCHMYS